MFSKISSWIDSIGSDPTRFTIALIASIIVILYAFFLFRNSRTERWRPLAFWGAILILLIGTVVHFFILREVGDKGGPRSLFTIVIMSIVSTFEMFFGSTKMFDNGIQEVLFGKDPVPAHTINLILLTAVYVAAMITTAYLIFIFFLRHMNSRIWLKHHKRYVGRETFVMFGINPYVCNLIKSIKGNDKHKDALILVVDYLTEAEKDMDVSVLERLNTFLFKKEPIVEDATVVLKAKKNLAYADTMDICASLGLKHLKPYLNNKTNIYLLLDNQDENVAALNNLLTAGICCNTIYCHARNDEINKEIEEAYHQDNPEKKKNELPGVVFVDSSMLAVRSLLRPLPKKEGEEGIPEDDNSALPINYVKIAQDETGQHLGYVESKFKAMILGFGETGQEALAFLYEYGAFVGKNKKKAPFECHVYDSSMDRILGSYEVSHPSLNSKDAGIYYHNMEIGHAQFRDSFEKEILDTNYVVVCGGSDDSNLRIIQFIMQHLGGKDTTDRFCIWVRMYNPNDIVIRTIESMGARENGCVKMFGEVGKIWLENVISDNAITEQAKEFHENYLKAKHEDEIPKDETWEEAYDKKIHNPATPRKDRLDAIRQKAQNYSNYFHASTKKALMDGPLMDDPDSVVQRIPVKYEGTLFTGDAKTRKILEYMAIGEHLRWQASHEVLGYRRGEKTDALLKIHEFIMDYSKLEPKTQHYDWEVVRTTLKWYADKKQQKNE